LLSGAKDREQCKSIEIIGCQPGDVNGSKQYRQAVNELNKYYDIKLLNIDVPGVAGRCEPVDLALAFWYGSVQPKAILKKFFETDFIKG
jgi:hypothetical protein